MLTYLHVRNLRSGPSVNTVDIIKKLKQFNVPATLFLNGNFGKQGVPSTSPLRAQLLICGKFPSLTPYRLY